MAELRLSFIEDGHEKIIVADKDEFIIGRFPDCDLQLSYSGISRYHCRLLKMANGDWEIEDRGSKNGTILNNKLIKSKEKLKQGDAIKLDNITISVSVTTPAAFLNPDMTLIGSVEAFQKQWIEAKTKKLEMKSGQESLNNYNTAIDRLQYLVEIAKLLSSAESIEEIFARVKEIILRELPMLDRLALLVDVEGNGNLKLMDATLKGVATKNKLSSDLSWISKTIVEMVFTKKVAIKTADAQADSRFEGGMTIVSKGIRSALAVPLLDKNQIFGILYGDALISHDNWQRGGDEDLSFFSAVGNLLASSVQRWLLSRKLRGEEIMRQRLERYHSPAIVQQLLKSGLSDGRLTPIEADISIMFADIVGFTALSERLSPAKIAKLLNNLFEEMLREIFKVGGTLDKFIGDCIMAFFGAPEPQDDHAERAVIAAKRMLDRLRVLNENNTLGENIQLRISINSGKAVVGDVGSSQRVDYTVLGPTINLAARMEAICPPGHCVISENTYKLLRSDFELELMGEHRFKGISRMILVYKIKN
ncbi:adenylate cyclase [Gammaproteobacteria bacterium]